MFCTHDRHSSLHMLIFFSNSIQNNSTTWISNHIKHTNNVVPLFRYVPPVDFTDEAHTFARAYKIEIQSIFNTSISIFDSLHAVYTLFLFSIEICLLSLCSNRSSETITKHIKIERSTLFFQIKLICNRRINLMNKDT